MEQMPTVEAGIRIGAPPAEVAGVLLNAALAPAWTAGLDRLELMEGEAGQPGCVAHAHYIEGGRHHTMVDVLQEVTPNRRFVSRVTGGGILATVETHLLPTGDGATELTVRWVGTGTKPLTRVLLPMLKRRIAQRAAADLQSLRELVETASRQQG